MEKESLDAFSTRSNEFHALGDYGAIKQEAEKLLAADPSDLNCRSYAAAEFIDASTQLNELELADRGIGLIKQLLAESGHVESSTDRYNLANGYMARAEMLGKRGQDEQASEARKQAKTLFQELLVKRMLIAPQQLCRIQTNYANLLSDYGRTIEAIDNYFDCLDIDQNHAMARGNCGIAVKKLLPISAPHHIRNSWLAWHLLTDACAATETVISVGGVGALDYFRKHQSDLETQIEHNINGGLRALNKWTLHRSKVHGIPKAPKWLREISQQRLLMTLNLAPLDSLEECVDDLYFQTISTSIGIDGEARFRSLAHYLNTIKEDFATARYLFHLSGESNNRELADNSAITRYANALDYADFGLTNGINKASFRIAADCLDKIAGFLNEYFRLGLKEKRVDFAKVWHEKADTDKPIHPILVTELGTNSFLRALKEVKDD